MLYIKILFLLLFQVICIFCIRFQQHKYDNKHVHIQMEVDAEVSDVGAQVKRRLDLIFVGFDLVVHGDDAEHVVASVIELG